MSPGWLTRSPADVPMGDAWLGPRERLVQARLHVPKRRADWRLGRWTAKAALTAWLGPAAQGAEVLAAADGAPEAWLDGERLPVSLSLSHRAGLALAVVAAAPEVVGCDLELVEPRSDAFVRDWLAPAEQAALAAAPADERARLANLLWTAKEAAAKVRREGLRLDLRQAVASAGAPGDGWQPLAVEWTGGERTAGWWRSEGAHVMTVAGTPAPEVPRRL